MTNSTLISDGQTPPPAAVQLASQPSTTVACHNYQFSGINTHRGIPAVAPL
jgi:hypothetical protein